MPIAERVTNLKNFHYSANKMFQLFPNVRLFLGFGARTLQAGVQQTSQPREVQNKNQNSTTQAMNKSKAESIAFSRLSAEFGIFAGSDHNAQSLVIGLRDGTGIMLTNSINGNSSSAGFTPPTGRMGYSNVSIALSLARQQLSGQGICQPTPHQLQAALVGGTITNPRSGNTIKLHGILQLKVQGMGWGKIANFLGIKLGSVIGEARPVPAVLQPSINSCASLVKKTRSAQVKDFTGTATAAVSLMRKNISAKTTQTPEKTAEQLT